MNQQRIAFYRGGQISSISLEELSLQKLDLFFVIGLPRLADRRVGRAERVVEEEGQNFLEYLPYKMFRTRQVVSDPKRIKLSSNGEEFRLPVGYYLFR